MKIFKHYDRYNYFRFWWSAFFQPEIHSLSRWLKILRLDKDQEIIQMVLNPENSLILNEIMRGTVQELEYWKILQERWHIPSFLIRIFQKRIFSPKNLNQEMIKYLIDHKGEYKTAILSNAGDETRNIMTNHFGFDKLVDEIIISAEEGIAKPDPELYQIAVEKLGTAMEKCLFVDDQKANVETALALGMHAIQYLNINQIMAELKYVLGDGE